MITTEQPEASRKLPNSKAAIATYLAHAGILPGIALTASIAGIAFLLHAAPYIGVLSAMILAIMAGMAVRNTVGIPDMCVAGVSFSLKKILRLSIVLLGLQISFAQVLQVGGKGLAVVATTLASTFLFTVLLGRKLGVDRKLTKLIAAGTSICGASAVVATNVVTDGRDEDVAYGVAVVTVFGSISMFVYPMLSHALSLSPREFGLWAGASIHEVAQVIAAAYQDGAASGQLATISKLSRVMMLAPVVLLLGAISARKTVSLEATSGRPSALTFVSSLPIPWFVFGFIAMIGFNTLNVLPIHLKTVIVDINQFLLAIALAAMGLETSVRKLKLMGLKPLMLGACAWIFISVFSYVLIRLAY